MCLRPIRSLVVVAYVCCGMWTNVAYPDGPNEFFTVDKIPPGDLFEQREIEEVKKRAPESSSDKPKRSELYDVDSFSLPSVKSKVPHRFIMTALLKHGEPVDRLRSITINGDQPSLYLYIKLPGTEQNKPYRLRLRVLDSKRELVFDREASFSSSTSSIVFRSVISPKRVIDEAGTWQFQGILNDELLFVESREVLFER